MNEIINNLLTSSDQRPKAKVENMLLNQAVATPWVN